MTTDRLSDADDRVRETCDVYSDGAKTIATIADPENGNAWIRSDHVQSIRP